MKALVIAVLLLIIAALIAEALLNIYHLYCDKRNSKRLWDDNQQRLIGQSIINMSRKEWL